MGVGPIGVNREAVLHRIGHSGGRFWRGRQPLQVAQALVVQLVDGIVCLVGAGNGAGAAEAIEVVDDAADAFGRTFGVVDQYSGVGVPFRHGVGGGQWGAVGVEALGPDVFHRRTKHASVPIDVLIHQVAERRHADAVAVLLDVAHGLVLAVRVALAQLAARIQQNAGPVGIADPDTRIEEVVAGQSSAPLPGRAHPQVGVVARSNAGSSGRRAKVHAIQAVGDVDGAGPIAPQARRHGIGCLCGREPL